MTLVWPCKAAAMAAVSMILITSCGKKEDKSRRMGLVERADVIQRTSLNGTIRGVRQSQVQSGYAGYIAKFFVKVGDPVKQGQPLVSVTQTLNQPLKEIYPIQSPFKGTVTQILQREGEYITTTGSSTTILIVDDLSEMWIDANIPEVDVAKISIGLECLIKASALQRKSYKGEVKTISLSSRQSTDRWDRGRVEYPAEIRITNPDKDLKTGMTAVVDVISAKVENVLTVRHEFLQRDKDRVFLLDEKGVEHDIEIGLTNEEVVEVKKGGVEGMKVQIKDFTKI